MSAISNRLLPCDSRHIKHYNSLWSSEYLCVQKNFTRYIVRLGKGPSKSLCISEQCHFISELDLNFSGNTK
uniref:Uncharacterized protein n=1 Tax=Anguilla anguilla TaxID=7936 RepID=A0A0E9W3H5_ANGAN